MKRKIPKKTIRNLSNFWSFASDSVLNCAQLFEELFSARRFLFGWALVTQRRWNAGRFIFFVFFRRRNSFLWHFNLFQGWRFFFFGHCTSSSWSLWTGRSGTLWRLRVWVTRIRRACKNHWEFRKFPCFPFNLLNYQIQMNLTDAFYADFQDTVAFVAVVKRPSFVCLNLHCVQLLPLFYLMLETETFFCLDACKEIELKFWWKISIKNPKNWLEI